MFVFVYTTTEKWRYSLGSAYTEDKKIRATYYCSASIPAVVGRIVVLPLSIRE